MDFEALDALASQLMRQRKAHLLRERGFIYRHGQRVAASVITLRQRVTEDDSHDEVLSAAALFHDVGKGIEPHERTGAALAQTLLAPYMTEAELEEVVFLIGAHKSSGIDSLWARLLMDADFLDHFGAVEIGLSFQYGAYLEEGMATTLDWYQTGFDQHAAHVRALLHFDVSRAVFDEKVEYCHAFARRLATEMAGGFVV